MYYYKTVNIGKLFNWYKNEDQSHTLDAVIRISERTDNEENSFELNGYEVFPYDVEIVADDLFVPWAMDITKDGRIFFTEKNGNIRLIENGVLQANSIYTFLPPFEALGEGGLLGLVLDPDFDNNGYFYVMYTYMDDSEYLSRVVRMHYEREHTVEDKVLLDSIPANRVHIGGRLKIGPDGKLYVTTGDAGMPELSQDISSLAGKILRMNLDGTIPSDNPFPDSYVYAFGIRNSQGLDWNVNNVLYASEHGDIAHDEINIIIPGGNYGWPLKEGNFITPLYDSGNETYAPSGIAFAKGGPYNGRLFISTLRGSQLLVMELSEDGNQVLHTNGYLKNEFGRLREAYGASDGSIYITTSNLDGRGLPNPQDDKMIRLVPRF